MLVPIPHDNEHLNCCLIEITKMADLIPFLENHNLSLAYPKIMNNSLKCSVINPLQVHVIFESCRINFGAVH